MTGYTSQLIERNLDFKQFALVCARAFGAFVEIRDEPLSSPLPDKITSDVSYEEERLSETKESLKRLTKMNKRQRIKYIKDKDVEYYNFIQNELVKDAKLIRQLTPVLIDAEKWEAPTSEHDGLKQFILSQLRGELESANWSFDYYIKALNETKNTNYLERFNDILTRLKEDVERYDETIKDIIDRTENKNTWYQDLVSSL